MIKWILTLLLFPLFVHATNYYISNTGNDNNAGTSPDKAWQTIAQLNTSFSAMRPGDNIFFKRGDTFYGSIIITSSGAVNKPILITAYGQGSNPVITGFTTLSGWIKKDGSVWQAPAGLVKNNLNMVTLNGIPQRIGRYPNADAADGGYLRYETFNNNISITDNELKDAANWTGAEVVIRKNHWTAERCRVTKQDGNTIYYTFANTGINTNDAPKLYNGTKGSGYFFQKDARTLDELGEWFFDTTNRNLQLFFGKEDPAVDIVKASTVDTLINIGNRSFISISHLSFEGANMSAIYCRAGSDIAIQHCSFSNIGAKAIHIWNTPNVLIEDVHTNYILSNAIQVRNSKQDNVTVKNCVIKNTAPFIGMGSFFDDRDYKAMCVMANNNLIIENNVVDTTGLSGIQFQGNNVMIKNNLVNYFCYLLDDGAGIYTYMDGTKENPGAPFVNRVVKDNIILHGIGAPEGFTSLHKAEGIYLDGRTMNVEVLNNTIAFVGNKALATNNPVNVTIRNNTCFNNGGGWGTARANNWEEIQHLVIKNNIFYSMNDQQSQVTFAHSGLDASKKMGVWETIQVMGDIDSNYYNTLNPLGFNYSYAPAVGKPSLYPSPISFQNWQELTHQDMHSKRPAKIIPLYVLKNIVGPNLVSNGDFMRDMNGVNVFGGNTSGQWDNSGKLGGGSVRIDFSEPQANRYGLIHSEVGRIIAGKKYIFRFKTLGTSKCGIVRTYLRKTASPYNALVPVQTQIFGLEKQPHEFMFAVDKNEQASYVIEIEKNSGTTYIGNIELYEANVTAVNIQDQVRFEYNATDKTVVIALDKNYVGVDGKPFSNSLTLEPFSSKILIADVNY